jgi:hypothetical protein
LPGKVKVKSGALRKLAVSAAKSETAIRMEAGKTANIHFIAKTLVTSVT